MSHRPSTPRIAPKLLSLCIGFAVLACALPSFAAPGPIGEITLGTSGARVRAELLVNAQKVAAGEPARVGVRFQLEPGWHIYWKNPGDSGSATEVDWHAPGGDVGSIEWPAPQAFREADGLLTTYGYEGDVLLASDATVAASAAGSWPLAVDASFVACLVECIPGKIRLARAIPVANTTAAAPKAVQALFDRAASRLPQTPEALGLVVSARAARNQAMTGEDVPVVIEIASCAEAGTDCRPWTLEARYQNEAFIPAEVTDLEVDARGLSRTPEARGMRSFSLLLNARAYEDHPDLTKQRLRGVVPLSLAGRATHVEIDVPIEIDPAGEASAAFAVLAALPASPMKEGRAAGVKVAGGEAPSLLLALMLGIVGGLILNLMPCVLPVLAIKIFAITDLAREERGHVVKHGMAYLVGVVASMWALAAGVVALRAAGTAVGWGFQLQNPIFLAAICTILVVFAMNLLGAFEIKLQPSGPDLGPQGEKSPASRSFFEGTLAVALATPCTAPFLGTAVGFAFASSGLVIFAVFTSIAIGLAAPFVLVTLVPGWGRFVPKPGAWMLRVRQALAFPLLATVAWLTWVAGRALGVDAQSLLLAYLIGVAFFFWLFGMAQSAARLDLARALAALSLLYIVGSLATLPLEPSARATTDTTVPTTSDGIPWKVFDRHAIERERAAGRPVFVDFTADWCITCKVNETVVLSTDAVRDELKRWDYAAFKADWTARDDEITRELGAFGRAGVPLYLVYPAGARNDPQLLPELLTIDATVEALRDAGRGGGA